MRKSIPLAERFWARVVKSDGCWLWTGATLRGYGYLNRGGQYAGNISTHRLSWQLHKGPIPEGLDVLHHCDNPPCVNPDHLFVGTAKDNVADMIAKGRKVVGCVFGEKHHSAKLNAEKVREIRRIYSAGGSSHRRLAVQFSVDRTTIQHVVNKTVWKHV